MLLTFNVIVANCMLLAKTKKECQGIIKGGHFIVTSVSSMLQALLVRENFCTSFFVT